MKELGNTLPVTETVIEACETAICKLRYNFDITYIWKMSLDPNFSPPCPSSHGWNIKDGSIFVEWMTKDPAPKAVLELISCKSCKKCNTKRCPCKAKGFQCTDSCKCDVNICENSEYSGTHIILEDSDTDED